MHGVRHDTTSHSPMQKIHLWNTEDSYALVDDDNYSWLSRFKWRACSGYACTNFGGVRVTMHAMLLQVPGGLFVDHINRNRIDNRMENLRVASPRENASNASRRLRTKHPYVGVRPTLNGKRWVARIGARGAHVGTFDTEAEAVRARDEAALKAFGPFATQNISDDPVKSPAHRPPRAERRRAERPAAGNHGRRRRS